MASYSPNTSAAEGAARSHDSGIFGDLTLADQAEQIGALRAGLAALRAQHAALDARGATERPDPSPEPEPDPFPVPLPPSPNERAIWIVRG